jgi:O-antigen/teichoic acid export membrane protein
MKEHGFASILRKSGTYAMAVLATRSLSFLLIPLYTRYLTAADYGVLELLDLTMNFVIVFAGLRLGQALFYFYFSEDDEAARQRHMSTNVVASAGIGAVISVAAWLLAAPLSKFVFGTTTYAPLFHLVAAAIGLSIPMETFLCCLRTFNEPGSYALISFSRAALAGVLNIVLLVWVRMGVAAMLWSNVISQAVIVAILAVHVFRRVPVRFDFASFRKQAGYTLPLSVGAIGEFLLNYGDRYFLRTAVSLSEIGIYSLAYKIGMLIPLVQYPFQLYWGSQEVDIVRQEGGWKIFTRVATYLTLGLTAVTVLITIFIHPILRVMVGPSFRDAARYAGWIALAYLIRAVAGYFREVFVIDKRPDLEAWVSWAGSAAVLTGYALLIPRYGLWGAVWATLAGFSVQFVCSFLVARRVRVIGYEYSRLIRIAVVSVLAVFVYRMLSPAEFWSQALCATAIGLVYIVVLLWVVLHSDELRMLRTLWQKLVSRAEKVPAQ